MTYRSRGEEVVTERVGQLGDQEGGGEEQVDDVVGVEQLPQLSLGFLRELQLLPDVTSIGQTIENTSHGESLKKYRDPIGSLITLKEAIKKIQH